MKEKRKKKKSNYKELGFCFGDKRKKRKSYFSKRKGRNGKDKKELGIQF